MIKALKNKLEGRQAETKSCQSRSYSQSYNYANQRSASPTVSVPKLDLTKVKPFDKNVEKKQAQSLIENAVQPKVHKTISYDQQANYQTNKFVMGPDLLKPQAMHTLSLSPTVDLRAGSYQGNAEQDRKSELILRRNSIEQQQSSAFDSRKKSNTSVNIPLLDFSKLAQPV